MDDLGGARWTRHHMTPLTRVLRAFCLLVPLVTVSATVEVDAAQAPTATIRGTVLDRANGTPLTDVSVQLQDSGQDVKTDETGRFELVGVEPGQRTLYVSIVGFILVERTVQVNAGEILDLTIPLSGGTGTYRESVTVTGERFREQERSVPSQQTLGSGDIQSLRNPITNDPMRAVQVLPGVTTGDDFKSEFAVRGSGFSRMNFTLDGIPTSFLLHTIQQVGDGGSIAMVNGDILEGITLLNGSYPQRYGNRLGAELDFQMREGSRDRRQLRVGVSGTDASAVMEGPIGDKRGSWLVSARKSYLELILKQISEENDFGFGFTDAQSKLVYDLSPSHRLDLSLIAGRSRLDQVVEPGDLNGLKDGRNAAQFLNAGWRFTGSPSLVATQRVAVALNQYSNTTTDGFELDRGGGRDITWRADVAAGGPRGIAIEGGAQLQWQSRQSNSQFRTGRQPNLLPLRLQFYDEGALFSSAYAQTRWSSGSRVSIAPGARLDRWSLTGETTASPWAVGEVQLSTSLKLRAGAGIHRQFPGFEQLAGLHARARPPGARAVGVRSERAYHTDIGVEQMLGAMARWQVTLYNREERDMLRLPNSELRVAGGLLRDPTLDSRWLNALDGHARGVELLIQRRSPTGLSGWASYSLGFNRYRDRTTGEAFDGDFDQRHTVNIHAQYRLTNRLSVAAKLRTGSNVPAVGYWEQRGAAYFVSSMRNELRVPAYSRLDLRGNRTFNWQGKRLTLFVEFLNVLGHENLRYTVPGVNGRTRQAFGIFEPMIPFVPSAGILLEF